jgi:hypothetical protein
MISLGKNRGRGLWDSRFWVLGAFFSLVFIVLLQIGDPFSAQLSQDLIKFVLPTVGSCHNESISTNVQYVTLH